MKILIVTDGSPEAEKALAFSATIVQRSTDLPTILAFVNGSGESDPSQTADIIDRAIQMIGIDNAHTRVLSGELTEGIVQEAESGGYDLIILGDQIPEGFFSRIRGSSPGIRVAECAPCSVLIIRGDYPKIHRILLCDSGAGRSSLLSRLVLQLSDLLEGEEDVTVLHVMSQISAGPGVRGKQLRADAIELVEEHSPEGEILENDLQMLSKPGIHPLPKVRHGLVVDEILAEARGGEYDLVVVGAHPVRSPQSLLLDNIAHQILKRISRPILVVRERE